MKFLLEQGANPNYSLFAASDRQMIRLLVRHGAIVDDPSFEYETPFLGSVMWSRFDKKHFRLLMKYGPRGDIKDADGKTAIEIMSRKRDPEFQRMAEDLAR